MIYHKIKNVWKRDPDKKFRYLLEGVYTTPEFEFLEDLAWRWTEKVDGTNVRVYWNPHVSYSPITFEGRKTNSQMPPFLIERLSEKFREVDLRHHFPGQQVTFYGEGFGEKIQKVGKKYGPVDFILFDIRIGDVFLERHNVLEIAYSLDLNVVPTIGYGSLPDAIRYARDGFDTHLGVESFPAEGIVAMPAIELCDRHGHRIITKIKTKDFDNG